MIQFYTVFVSAELAQISHANEVNNELYQKTNKKLQLMNMHIK